MYIRQGNNVFDGLYYVYICIFVGQFVFKSEIRTDTRASEKEKHTIKQRQTNTNHNLHNVFNYLNKNKSIFCCQMIQNGKTIFTKLFIAKYLNTRLSY